MRHVGTACVLAGLLAACAQGSAPASQPVRTSKPASPFEGPTPLRALDQMVPVLVMEQFYTGPTRLQGYRVRLFKDGHGYYDGLKHVDTLGQQDFRIKPEEVQQILDDFKKYKFWQVPEDQLGGEHPFAVPMLEFTLRDGNRYKTVKFAGQSHATMLQHVVESRVDSARWRCPYVDDRNIDLCASLDSTLSRTVSAFRRTEFPRLQETYK